MTGQHISASFSVIILSQDSGRPSPFGHAPLCFHALIGCFRKEGCISLTLPASCCVRQQFKAPPHLHLHLLHGSFLSPDLTLLSRNPLVKYLSSRRHPVSFTVIVTHIVQETQTQSPSYWRTGLKLKLLCYRPPVGWCALECILIIEAARSVRPSSPQT